MNWRGWFRTHIHPSREMPLALNLPQSGVGAINRSAAVRRAALGAVEIPARTLIYRSVAWQQGSPDSPRGTVRFVREVAVEGRAVESEIEVSLQDLEPQPDGTFRLRGR